MAQADVAKIIHKMIEANYPEGMGRFELNIQDW
jgi:hypothetical protein